MDLEFFFFRYSFRVFRQVLWNWLHSLGDSSDSFACLQQSNKLNWFKLIRYDEVALLLTPTSLWRKINKWLTRPCNVANFQNGYREPPINSSLPTWLEFDWSFSKLLANMGKKIEKRLGHLLKYHLMYFRDSYFILGILINTILKGLGTRLRFARMILTIAMLFWLT